MVKFIIPTQLCGKNSKKRVTVLMHEPGRYNLKL